MIDTTDLVTRRKPIVDAMTVAEAYVEFGAPKGDMEKKVCLLRPYLVFSKNSYSTPIVPPIGVAYLASIVEAAGYSVYVIDAVGEDVTTIRLDASGLMKLQGLSIDGILDRIDPNTSVLGVSLMFSQEWVAQRELINRIHEARPDLTIVVGGEHATALPEYVLRNCPVIDYVVTGEGELTFLRLLHRIFTGRSVEGLQGIDFLDSHGCYVHTGLGLRIVDFQNLPRPAWHLIPVENYFSGKWSFAIGTKGNMSRNMPALATRGCPYKCTFCSNPGMWTQRYVMRDPVDVVDEFEWLIDTYNITSVDLADLTAIVKKEWTLEFCSELKRRNLGIDWQLPVGTRSEALDYEVLKAIYETGCKLVVYAPESGAPETLKKIKKMVSIPAIMNSIKTAVKIGHTAKVNFIIGFPDEGRKSVMKTLLMMVRLAFAGTRDCNINIFTPYPGTELFQQLRDDGTIPELDDAYFNGLVIKFDFTSLASVCKRIPPRELRAYRVLGMILFYGLSYLLHPMRLVATVKSLLKGNFIPQSLFEQRAYDYVIRRGFHTHKQPSILSHRYGS